MGLTDLDEQVINYFSLNIALLKQHYSGSGQPIYI